MASAYAARIDATRRKLRRIEKWIRNGSPPGDPGEWPGLGADRADVMAAENPLREWATLILARLPKSEADAWLTQWQGGLTEAASPGGYRNHATARRSR